MTPTYTRDLLCAMLQGGLEGMKASDILKANYNLKGAEALIEYNGGFYKVTIEHCPVKAVA